jgi:hypothetical protein
MKTSVNIVFGRFAVVVAVLGISMLGNLRLQASERTSAARLASTVVGAHQAGSRVGETFGSDADDVTAGDDVATSYSDDGGLVPAIYAWDPDVRFVYYRHVSKWM